MRKLIDGLCAFMAFVCIWCFMVACAVLFLVTLLNLGGALCGGS